jgi:peptidoglycan/LPS O-acetylase OafA/YrhL
MNKHKRKEFLIRLPYWLGIGADALWVVALLFPSVYAMLVGSPGFDPDFQVRLIMGVGGSLMAGWTMLLLWAVRQPIERRAVILLTAFPVTSGISIVTLIGFLNGSTPLWLLVKTIVLTVSMITSYFLSNKLDKEEKLSME